MPRRWMARFALMAGIVAITLGTTRAQFTGARDTLVFLDTKDNKIVSIDTEVKKETAGGVEYLVGKEARFVPATDIIRVDYGGLPGVTKTDIGAARTFEDTNDLEKAKAKYEDILTKAGAANPKSKKYLSYRVAHIAARMTDQKMAEEDFKVEAARSAKELADFAQENPKSWEAWPASRTAARMQMELGLFDAAAATLGKLAASPDLVPELKFDAAFAQAAALIRAGKTAEAETVLSTAEKDAKFPATGPLRQRLAILQIAAKLPTPTAGAAPTKPAAAVAQLEKAIADATDPVSRAVGFNFLGDLYRSHGFARDAMWAYLWIDVVYSQDRDERVLAIRKLATIFGLLGDNDRATIFREKLPSARS